MESNKGKKNWADYSSDEDDVPSRKYSENIPSRKQSSMNENVLAKNTTGFQLEKKDIDLIHAIESKKESEIFLSIFNAPYEFTDKRIKSVYSGFNISSVEKQNKGVFVFGFSNKQDAVTFVKDAVRTVGSAKNSRIIRIEISGF